MKYATEYVICGINKAYMTYEVFYPLAYIDFCEFTQGAYVQMSNSLTLIW